MLCKLVLYYLTNKLSHVCYSGAVSSHLGVLSGFQHGSVLGLLIFSVCINDSNAVIFFYYIIFVADINFCVINSPQSDIDCIHGWCTSNDMKSN